jgi:hypothetical protein
MAMINGSVYESVREFDNEEYKIYGIVDRAISIMDIQQAKTQIKRLSIEAIVYIRQRGAIYGTMIEKLIMVDNREIIKYILNRLRDIMDEREFKNYCLIISKACYNHRRLYSIMAGGEQREIMGYEQIAQKTAKQASEYIMMYFEMRAYYIFSTAPLIPIPIAIPIVVSSAAASDREARG